MTRGRHKVFLGMAAGVGKTPETLLERLRADKVYPRARFFRIENLTALRQLARIVAARREK